MNGKYVSARLLVYACERADADGVCFVHPRDDGPPEYVVMTAERYRTLTGRIFPDDIPVDDPEWLHDHATPEMLTEWEGLRTRVLANPETAAEYENLKGDLP